MKSTCKCGNEFNTTQKRIDEGRGIYCSRACMYKYRLRPKGLKYTIVNENPTWIKKGERLSPQTEFKKGIDPHNKNKFSDSYWAVHAWIKRQKGKAKICEQCESTKHVQWANISHEYKKEIDDWKSLCCKCHMIYDHQNDNWGKAKIKYKK
jgi:hypothetical protein